VGPWEASIKKVSDARAVTLYRPQGVPRTFASAEAAAWLKGACTSSMSQQSIEILLMLKVLSGAL
jgi:hypothetical protein